MRSKETEAPRTFTESARRAQLLGCAVEVLAEAGYAGASLAEIARRAGMSKSVVLYYFSGKDALLEQVLHDVYSRAGRAIAVALSREEDPAARITAYVHANLRFLGEHPRDIRAVVEIAANARRSDGSPRFRAEGGDPVLAHLEQLLREGQEGGHFRDFDAHHLAVMIRGAIDTASGQLALNPSFDLTAYTRTLTRMVELAADPPET